MEEGKFTRHTNLIHTATSWTISSHLIIVTTVVVVAPISLIVAVERLWISLRSLWKQNEPPISNTIRVDISCTTPTLGSTWSFLVESFRSLCWLLLRLPLLLLSRWLLLPICSFLDWFGLGPTSWAGLLRLVGVVDLDPPLSISWKEPRDGRLKFNHRSGRKGFLL